MKAGLLTGMLAMPPNVLDKSYVIQQKLDYIHDNPVRAGLVYEPWQYPYSSALDYYGKGTGMLSLELLIGLLFSTAGRETGSLLS